MSNLVSVCIPVYNGEKTIEETVKSVLSQTYKELEIIIVDNCSTDKTWLIIDSFNDPRIKKFKNNSNIGMVGNWNKCLECATGEYVHFLCGDDILTADSIEKKVILADSDEDISLVFSASEIINEKDNVVMVRRQFRTDCVFEGKKLARKSFLSKNLYGEPSNVLFRRSLLSKIGDFSENMFYSIDWEMWLRLSVHGTVGYISVPLMKYRISKSNGTSSLSVKNIILDDKIFVQNLLKLNVLKLGFLEILCHRFAVFLRLYARKIFMKIWC